MILEDIKEILIVTATVSTILQFMSGMLVCQKFMKKGSTEQESGFPFIAGFLSCSLWFRYGLMIEDQATVLVNFIGTILMFACVVTYYLFTPRKKVVMRQMFIVLIVIVVTHLYARYEENTKLAIKRFGLITCCTSLVFFAAPLSNLYHVIRMKNTETLPFPLILMTWVVSLQWYTYGVIIKNTFMQYPNMIGFVLASFQLLLFVIYPSYQSPNVYLKDQSARLIIQ
ncbi:sugar transporter SWEET1-like isoform X1 [Nilaparvata lugens]|uniref:Sugar transporter SWEET n=1 Tax=Nilaparvata lugens TaxID=108931 RepID=A0A0A8JAH4_NILLU|nr:sugar transporter SWEET1-like isoform X1 [Nilaparvata lugens]XP_039296574.1 sugar transporter SWEET1-like isoform X2 [Nilaparvata lugens]XP_039296575.1 sugar transporter SWEET1-like isoform X1 [Nilaparvata lugens]XP_039296576.1 sugar transporter SWEET1-like isoform X1 [Nilaparvata lugens]XP_039296577.1 sugar transporter SWEET1-like isoform X1 [Nilaparvata lugens]XP_039296578.1 sugar transporter SWEET1-like isoform X1 [Nilaparvata lugens]BAQ02381.1 SWEET sugar transporter [Nilaparvata lugen